MRSFYVVPTATLQATPPQGSWHGVAFPADATRSLVVVEGWRFPDAQDMWEDLTDVTTLHPENWSQPIPAALATAFAPWGVQLTDSTRQAFRKIRSRWPGARP